jgi:hypothetical protein
MILRQLVANSRPLLRSASGATRLLGSRFPRWVGIVVWTSIALAWALRIVIQQFDPLPSWLYDWHVYAAAAKGLVEGTLYHVPLHSAFPLPVEVFNYPPLSAFVAAPLLLLSDQVAGTLWVATNVAAEGIAAILVARLLRLSDAVVWAGVAFFIFSFNPWGWLELVGNNTPLVLLLVAGFARYHTAGHQRRAGALLGIAIGMKLWPAALLPLLLRERRWSSLLVVGGIIFAAGVATVAWLGSGVIGPLVGALQVRGTITQDNPVYGITWLSQNIDWWPSWGGSVIAAALAFIPANGRLGLGLGILAGMAAVPNLWRQYLSTVFVGLLLVAFGLWGRWRDRDTVDGRLRVRWPRWVPLRRG